MITDIEDFFAKGCGRCARFATADCSTRAWAAGLADLRFLCLNTGLVETLKWGHPCYTHAGRNIAIIGALRGDFRLTFFDAALMTDRLGLLERQGANTQHPDMIRFTENGQVATRAEALRSYLAEAMANAEAGRRAPRTPATLDLHEDMAAALDADPELAEAFHRLTPGRQRSHAIHVGAARTQAGRAARIERARGMILAGKGMNEREARQR
jgi:uncharacterized protein YdeI (YjbR/CyaY-like superfamily)